MSRLRLLLVALLAAVSLDLGAAACVRLPQGGPVRSVAAQDDAGDESLYDFTPPGPLPGAERVPLVDNFLTSMTATPLSTYVAREFLTASSSRSWVPERGTVVYGTQQIVNGPEGTVVLRLRDVVELDSRGTWRGDPTHGRGRDYRLRLVKEDGEWRIQNPPDRLFIPRAHFDAHYEQYLLYFPEQSGQVLVPEPVYVAARPADPDAAGGGPAQGAGAGAAGAPSGRSSRRAPRSTASRCRSRATAPPRCR